MYTAKKEGDYTLTANGQSITIHVSTAGYKAKYDAEDSGDGSSSSTDGSKPEPTDGPADEKF